MPVVEKDHRFEGFKESGPKEGELPPQKVFEGFTTPGPIPREVVPLEAWNEPAYIQTLIDEGFQHAADEGFRFHIYRFGGGGAPLSAKSSKKDEPLRHEDPKAKNEHKHVREGH